MQAGSRPTFVWYDHHRYCLVEIDPTVLVKFYVFTRTWLRYVQVFAIQNPSVVCNVCAPYSRGWNFRQYFFSISYRSLVAILWPPCKTTETPLADLWEANPAMNFSHIFSRKSQRTARAFTQVFSISKCNLSFTEQVTDRAKMESLARPAMRHWSTSPLNFQIQNFAAYARAALSLYSNYLSLC